MSGGGWDGGSDPVQRWLRIVSVLVFLGLTVYLLSDRAAGVNVIPAVGIVVGTLLILLGYERLIRLPGVGRRKDDE